MSNPLFLPDVIIIIFSMVDFSSIYLSKNHPARDLNYLPLEQLTYDSAHCFNLKTEFY